MDLFYELLILGTTNTNQGLEFAEEILNSSPRVATEVVLLMTDGEPTENLNQNLNATVIIPTSLPSFPRSDVNLFMGLTIPLDRVQVARLKSRPTRIIVLGIDIKNNSDAERGLKAIASTNSDGEDYFALESFSELLAEIDVIFSTVSSIPYCNETFFTSYMYCMLIDPMYT